MFRALAIGALAALSSLPGLAEEPAEELLDRFSFSAEVSALGVDSSVRLDSTAGTPGTPVDLESDLGLDSSKRVPSAVFEFSPGRRHRLLFAWTALDRDGSQVLDQPIFFGDEVFLAGQTLITSLKVQD